MAQQPRAQFTLEIDGGSRGGVSVYSFYGRLYEAIAKAQRLANARKQSVRVRHALSGTYEGTATPNGASRANSGRWSILKAGFGGGPGRFRVAKAASDEGSPAVFLGNIGNDDYTAVLSDSVASVARYAVATVLATTNDPQGWWRARRRSSSGKAGGVRNALHRGNPSVEAGRLRPGDCVLRNGAAKIVRRLRPTRDRNGRETGGGVFVDYSDGTTTRTLYATPFDVVRCTCRPSANDDGTKDHGHRCPVYAAIEGGSASRSNPDGAPNLDNMTLDPKELRDLGDDAVATPSKYAKEWFGKNTVQTRAAARSLGRYAYAKAEAMAFRLAGNIVSARDNEDRADAIYARLPEWARW